jgi:hypothetical protein
VPDPLPAEPSSRIEALNSIVRAAVTLLFGASVCYGFLFARINNLTLVSPDAFSTIAIAVILWWFKDRSDKDKAKETAALVTAATTVPTLVATSPTPEGAGPAPNDKAPKGVIP